MQKLSAADPETKSPDLAKENLAALRALFPELVTEGKDGVAVNLDVLKQLVGDRTVTDADEKYGLKWHGKRRARQLALTPSTGTLRPCPEDSVDWDTTKNLMIEGDNLEVLKLLQKSYAGKVKLIYIDPPYNTGKDFVYPDNFQDNIKNYLELTGQTGEGGKKLSSNTEASGRFHTDWLNMMYPRLKLARNLLREDGVIFISIDDNEAANLKKLCDEVYGEDNFVGSFKWNRVAKAPSLSDCIRSKYEFVFAYFKSDRIKFFGKNSYNTQGPLWHLPNKRNELLFPGKSIKVRQSFNKGHYGGTYDVELLDDLIEENGLNKNAVRIVAHSAWGQSKIDDYFKGGSTFEIKKSPMTLYTTLSSDDNYIAPSDLITKEECGVGTNTEASDALKKLDLHFDYPKPVSLIKYFVKMVTHEDSSAIILDFFSGSAATAHAVMELNADEGGKRRHIMVQLPEPCDEISEAFKAGYKSIAEIGRERVRRAGKKIREEWEKKQKEQTRAGEAGALALEASPLPAGNPSTFPPDLGFRVFKLASSNIRAWEPDRDKLAETLEASIEHLKTDRTEQDILFELLLKLGLDLCVPIERKKIEGAKKQVHEIHSIGGGSLLVCLSPAIPQADVEPLALGLVAWHKALKPAGETTVVFRDSAFADDVAKTNLTAILHQHGLETVRSL